MRSAIETIERIRPPSKKEFEAKYVRRSRPVIITGLMDEWPALKAAIATAPGLKSITAEARDLVRRPVLATELKKTDAVVFDPPRAGAAEQAGEIARSSVPRVVAVSCNPATFARDARILTDAGFRLERVHPIDQFLWSPHLELVGVFGR